MWTASCPRLLPLWHDVGVDVDAWPPLQLLEQPRPGCRLGRECEVEHASLPCQLRGGRGADLLARLGCRRRGGHTGLPGSPRAGNWSVGPGIPAFTSLSLPEWPRLGVRPQECRSQSYTKGRVAAQCGPWARPSRSHCCMWGSLERGTGFPRGPGLLEAVWGQARPASPCPSASR